jgi:hypothetical protein
MRKLVALAVAIVFVLIATIAYAVTVPEKVTISAAAAKQGPVTFNHAKHATTLVKTCETCHHNHKGLTKETKAEVKKCTGCHLDTKGKIITMRDPTMVKNPFHIRCVSCHKAAKKGPVICTGCHAKKG